MSFFKRRTCSTKLCEFPDFEGPLERHENILASENKLIATTPQARHSGDPCAITREDRCRWNTAPTCPALKCGTHHDRRSQQCMQLWNVRRSAVVPPDLALLAFALPTRAVSATPTARAEFGVCTPISITNGTSHEAIATLHMHPHSTIQENMNLLNMNRRFGHTIQHYRYVAYEKAFWTQHTTLRCT